jgi:Domain of unknown function (DUF397)
VQAVGPVEHARFSVLSVAADPPQSQPPSTTHRARHRWLAGVNGALAWVTRASVSSVQMSQSTPNLEALPHSNIIGLRVRPLTTSSGSTTSLKLANRRLHKAHPPLYGCSWRGSPVGCLPGQIGGAGVDGYVGNWGNWHKSSHSGECDCVEVRMNQEATEVRNSRNVEGTPLRFNQVSWRAFTTRLHTH